MAGIKNTNKFLMNTGVWCTIAGVVLSPKMGFISEDGSYNGLVIALMIIGVLLSSAANLLRLRERGELTLLILIGQVITAVSGGILIIRYFIQNYLDSIFLVGVVLGVVLIILGRAKREY